MIDLALVNETILAVDIGARGGIVWNEHGKLNSRPMPTVNITVDDKHRTKVAFSKLWDEIYTIEPNIIVAEDVRIFPGQGPTSGASLIEQKGVMIGFAAALDVELCFIQPQNWITCYTTKKSKFFVNADKKKDINAWKEYLASVAREQLPPELHEQVTLKTADAFLMWNYFAQIRIGQPMEKMESQLKWAF